MNKKVKLIVALTLIIQLLIPSYLLYHHYSVINYALKSSTEYKFRLDYINFYGYAQGSSDTPAETLTYSVDKMTDLYNKKIDVSTDENSLTVFSELEHKNKTDCWFDYDYYSKNCIFDSDEYSFESGLDAKDVINEILNEYSWVNRNNENKTYAYVTAKIYKGAFIPTAIYFGDTKIITIQNSEQWN